MKDNFVFPNKLVTTVYFNSNSTVVETISHNRKTKGGHKHSRYLIAKSINELASLAGYKEHKRFITRTVEPRFTAICEEYAGKQPTLVIGHENRPLFIALFEDDNYALCIRREGRQNWEVLSAQLTGNVAKAKYGDNSMYCTTTFSVNAVAKKLKELMPNKSNEEINKFALITKLIKENDISLNDLQDYVMEMTGVKKMIQTQAVATVQPVEPEVIVPEVVEPIIVEEEITQVEPEVEPVQYEEVSKMNPVWSDALKGYACTDVQSITVVRADKLAPYYDATFTEEETKGEMTYAARMLLKVTGVDVEIVRNRISEISTKKYATQALVIANNHFGSRVDEGFEFTEFTDMVEKLMKDFATQKLNIEKDGKFTHIPKKKFDKNMAHQNGQDINVDQSYVCNINEAL